MALSTKKKGILNRLFDFIPALRKGQISPADGGDVRLGDMLDGFRIASSAQVTMAASPQATADGDAEIGDLVMVQLLSDDTGGALGALAGTVSVAGTVSITAAGGVTAGDGAVRYYLIKAQV